MSLKYEPASEPLHISVKRQPFGFDLIHRVHLPFPGSVDHQSFDHHQANVCGGSEAGPHLKLKFASLSSRLESNKEEEKM